MVDRAVVLGIVAVARGFVIGPVPVTDWSHFIQDNCDHDNNCDYDNYQCDDCRVIHRAGRATDCTASQATQLPQYGRLPAQYSHCYSALRSPNAVTAQAPILGN